MSNRLPVLAIEIRRAHADVGEAAKTAAERAIAAGHALIEAKSLLGHGKWLPWLRDNCALAERTAQLYIRVAKSGVKPATLADLGLKVAAKAIVLNYPDMFSDLPDDELIEWRLYLLWQTENMNRYVEDSEHHCEWLKRNGWASPTEWMGEVGDRVRKSWGMKPAPLNLKSSWFSFLSENLSKARDDIEAEITELAKKQPKPMVAPKRRRRKPASGHTLAFSENSCKIAAELQTRNTG